MRPVPFTEMLSRISGELKNQHSVFGINEDRFYSSDGKNGISVFSQECSNAIGPAAGPHTQLCQNIVASYLSGARFIELKTVQIMDHLEIEKPCIDARDEGYNVEWSTEFTLEKAYDEYLKAWIILHILEALSRNKAMQKPSFIFNMSVGYNLEGIKQEKMQRYIDSMIDADLNPSFRQYIEEARVMLEDGIFEGTLWEGREAKAIKALESISACISPSVTISTMHGCPPKEIEAICSYMLTEKKLDTFVKLNPTLLGYDRVRRILDDLGFGYITLRRESFEKDLQKDDAIAMLHRLADLAEGNGRGFGVKLTNTLGSVNDQGVLPGDEMYMSGRALMPVSLSVALMLSEEFGGKLPISYSGGITALTVKDVYAAGIRPITLATDMLKPGGYTKLGQMAAELDSMPRPEGGIDIARLSSLLGKVLCKDSTSSKDFRGTYNTKIGTPLGLIDCFVAPCIEACPIHQDIPDYIQLAGEGRWAEALGVIYMKNALPNMTGWICDHQCQNHCTRIDYEGPVNIREIKRQAAEKGIDRFKAEIWERPEEPGEIKAAVIGAGPAGLAASFFLARSGFDTHVFEKEESAGGVVRNIIPEFRIPSEAVDRDVEFIKENGVQFHFSADVTVDQLRDEGFQYIFIAIGATKSNDPGVSGNGMRDSAISFLLKAKNGNAPSLGEHPVIIGGGNTAMDASRMAKRCPGVKDVKVLYRRSLSEMPADLEEYRMALEDGVEFMFLSNPANLTDGRLTVDRMVLSEKDASGRRRPVASGEQFAIDCTYLISAIGEKVDPAVLASIKGESDDVYIIGDADTGPSTIVRCIRSASDAVDKAIDDVYDRILEEDEDDSCECGCKDGECTCGEEEIDEEYEDDEKLREAEDEYFSSIREKRSRIIMPLGKDDPGFASREAGRCLECSYVCTKCVDVCPNRANVALDVRETGIFDDPYQIIHLDAYCNECGNCATFCPHSGAPYKDKFTLFSSLEDFQDSTNSGFVQLDDKVIIRLDGKLFEASFNRAGELEADGVPIQIVAMIEEIYLSYSYLLGPVEE